MLFIVLMITTKVLAFNEIKTLLHYVIEIILHY